MNSWKTINLSKQYGSCRLWMLSIFTILMSFMTAYTCLSTLPSREALYDDRTLVFFALLLLLYPVHQLLHYLPMRIICKKVKTSWSLKGKIIPICKIQVPKPIRKQFYLVTLAFPFLLVSPLLIGGALVNPHYIHYFTILFSLHTGLCVSDFICLKNLVGSPERSFIEEHGEGYDILIQK